MGGSWRMPTKEEIQELIDNCSWEWMDINGIYGYRVIGLNGNFIFLPAGGCRFANGSKPLGMGESGYYWSKSHTLSSSYFARSLCFHKDLAK